MQVQILLIQKYNNNYAKIKLWGCDFTSGVKQNSFLDIKYGGKFILFHTVPRRDILFSMLSGFLWATPMCNILLDWILNID